MRSGYVVALGIYVVSGVGLALAVLPLRSDPSFPVALGLSIVAAVGATAVLVVQIRKARSELPAKQPARTSSAFIRGSDNVVNGSDLTTDADEFIDGHRNNVSAKRVQQKSKGRP